MKLEQLFEASSSGLKKGQKITVTRDSPAFSDVPTAGAGNGYLHRFQKGDVLRIYSIGKVWIVVESLSDTTGIYKWKTGNKITEFKTKNYKWRIAPEKFNGDDWFEAQTDTKPDDWMATTLDEAKEWLSMNGMASGLTDNGDGTFDASTVRLRMRTDDKIRIKFRKVFDFSIEKAIPSLELVPTGVTTLALHLGKGQSLSDLKSTKGIETLGVSGQFEDLSKFPEFPDCKRVTLSGGKVKSIKGLMKTFPKLMSIGLYETPNLKSGFLELPMINADNINSITLQGGNAKATQAFKIAREYRGQGKSGVIKAQDELIDADLEDFE